MPDPRLLTTVVGSFPQPDWLIDRQALAIGGVARIRKQGLWRIPEQFLDAAQALVQDVDSEVRRVELKVGKRALIASARVVIVASGLGARCFDRQHDETRLTSRTSRIVRCRRRSSRRAKKKKGTRRAKTRRRPPRW